jgi:hypothetical protein
MMICSWWRGARSQGSSVRPGEVARGVREELIRDLHGQTWPENKS